MKQNGAGFEVTDRDPLISNVLVTDVEVGPDCRVYISDWVDGWAMPGKGRLYRVYDDGLSRSPLALETKKIIAEGMDKRSPDELAKLLAHPDQRVRQEAQFALADRAAVPVLAQVAQKNSAPLARLHAVWGLGQIAAKGTTSALDPVLALLSDNDAEVVAQAAKILGDARSSRAYDGLVRLLPNTQNPRGQFFAALGLGKLGQKSAVKPIYDLLRNNADRDVFLRHAGVMGLVWINDVDAILAAAKDNSAAVRMASLLALRRLERPEVANFLKDAEPKIVLEAARAINDASIFSGLPQLAQLVAKDGTLSRSAPSAASHRAPELELPLWRRVINANFRLGQSDNATALARLVAQKDNPLAARAEAMQQLGEWAKPSGRDTLTGLWRPLSPRDPKIAADALRPVIAGILKDAPNDVRLQAAESVGKLGVKEAGGALFELVSDKNISAMVRVEALRALAALIDKKLADAIKIAAADSNESLRVEAVNLQARLKPANATDKLVAVLERGTVGEQQNALTTLGTVEGSEAERILGEWLDKMMAGKVPPALQVDLLEAAGKRPAPAIKDRLKKYQESLPKTDDLAPYRIALVGGNAAEGKKIFFEKPEASCVRCHKVGEEGGEVGPVLTGVASRNPREYLLESVVFPNKQIAKGFETLIVSLKNGTAYAGIVKSEDDKELVLNSPEEGLVKIKKADIEKRDTGLSGMPEGLGEVLSKRDLRDLIEFLGSQK
jgi:quinoprotein glucose dehydrogenase